MNFITNFLADFYMSTVFAISMAIDVHRYLKEERKENNKMVLST